MDKKQMEEAQKILDEKLSQSSKEKTEEKKEAGKPEQKQGEVAKTQPPQTIKVGDMELPIEEAQKLIAKAKEVEEIEKKHGNLVSLYSEFTRRSQRLKEAEGRLKELETKVNLPPQTKTKVENINSKIENLDEEAKKIREQAKKYGLVLDEDLKQSLADVQKAKEELLQIKESVLKEVSEIKNQYVSEKAQEVKEDLEMDLQEAQTNYPFIKRNELLDYMIEQAKTGRTLSVDEAVKEKYKDEVIDFEIKKRTGKVPTTDATSTGEKPEPPKQKGYSFEEDKGKIYDEGLSIFEAALQKAKL
jgi:hypothetical protein